MFGRIHTKLLTGHGKQGRSYHLLLQLPSLNHLQAYITFELKRKHNTFFLPPSLCPGLRSAVTCPETDQVALPNKDTSWI